jgi:cytochrome P450
MASLTGQDWIRVRSIVNPTFSSGKMKKMYSIIKYCMNQFFEVLGHYATNGRSVNMTDMFGNFTMNVIATCFFAFKSNAQKDPKDLFVKTANNVCTPEPFRVIPLLIFPKFLINLLKWKSFIEESAIEFFFNVIRHVNQ